jgi:hypothetical protein
MTGGVKMFRSMPVRRIVAAAFMPTDAADAQMYPPISGFQAFLTALGARFNILNLVKLGAGAQEILL